MVLYVCAVFDSAAEAFGRPFCVNAKGLAVRSFIDEVNRAAPDNQMHHHSIDYCLYYLGTFDDASGTFSSLAVPEQLMRGDVALNNEYC